MTPKDVIKMAQENKAVMANFKFLDFPGIWQHLQSGRELKEEYSKRAWF
jgi:glutamine synthetase